MTGYLKNGVGKVVGMALLFLIISTITSCSNAGEDNRRRLMQLELGMTRAQVVNIMGLPHHNEAYVNADGKQRGILYYGIGAIAPASSFMPLVFEDGRLIGWGEDSLRRAGR